MYFDKTMRKKKKVFFIFIFINHIDPNGKNTGFAIQLDLVLNCDN
jgi:hypothetical protein